MPFTGKFPGQKRGQVNNGRPVFWGMWVQRIPRVDMMKSSYIFTFTIPSFCMPHGTGLYSPSFKYVPSISLQYHWGQMIIEFYKVYTPIGIEYKNRSNMRAALFIFNMLFLEPINSVPYGSEKKEDQENIDKIRKYILQSILTHPYKVLWLAPTLEVCCNHQLWTIY